MSRLNGRQTSVQPGGFFARLSRSRSKGSGLALTPERTAAQHQALLHLVGQGDWSDQQALGKIRELALPGIECHGEIEAWIIDDTGFRKKGRHSVGVARQLRSVGQARQLTGCRDASLANHHAACRWPIDSIYQGNGRRTVRRRKTGVPKDITFKTKPAIALDHVRWACAWACRAAWS